MDTNDHVNQTGTCAESDKMRLHLFTLSFRKDLEALYTESSFKNDKYLLHIRLVLALTILFYSAFGFLDALLFPEGYQSLLRIRFGIVCPWIFITILFSFTRFFEKYCQLSFFLVSVIAGGGIVMMVVLTPPPATYSYYAGLILVFMFTYTFGRVRFVWATAACLLVTLFYEISAIYFADTPIPVLVNNNFFFISANLIGMVSCYTLEYFNRRNFFITLQLENEKRKTKEINLELEKRVLERTALLNTSNEELRLEVDERKRVEEELRKISNELEIRVENRTFELVNTNRELEKAKKKADASALAKSEFLANMSHEIRNPMNAIIGMVDLAMNDRIHMDQRKKYLEIIKKSSRSLLVIINDILDLSKIEAGKLDMDIQPFDIREYVESVGDIFITEFQSKGLEFIIDIADDIPGSAIGDPVRLQQVLLNLIGNALKFTETGEICLKLTKGNVSHKNVELLFEVSDTGIGIDLHRKRDLFEAFSQGDGSITRQYGGTGLGLTICKRIVNMMNGTIYVESTPGVGSSFRFSVVLDRDHDPDTDAVTDLETVDPLDVLLIVHNQKLQNVCARLLKSYGFYITAVDNGIDAIETIRRLPVERNIDLIVMDEDVPEKNCMEILDAVRYTTSDNPPPLVMLGKVKTEDEIAELVEKGVTDYIAKPLKSTLLYNAILSIFRKQNSEFTITEKLPDLSNRFKGMKVLLVEDNPINQIVASEILSMEGVSVTIAGNGQEAIEALAEKRPDIVFMDIQMPKMDGIQATQIIRKTLGKELPVIAMTAHVMHSDREKCIETGMNDFISKPIEQEELLRVLSKYYQPETESALEKVHRIIPAGHPVSLHGIDIDDAVKRLSCTYKVFSEILANFCSYYRNIDKKINAMIVKNDLDRAAKEIHSLKGAAINVSAVNLYLMLQEFEVAVLESDGNDDLSDFVTLLKEKLNEVEAACQDLKNHVTKESEIRL